MTKKNHGRHWPNQRTTLGLGESCWKGCGGKRCAVATWSSKDIETIEGNCRPCPAWLIDHVRTLQNLSQRSSTRRIHSTQTFERQELENRISSIRWRSWSAKQNTSSNADGSQECSWELSWNQLIESRAINPEKSSNARTPCRPPSMRSEEFRGIQTRQSEQNECCQHRSLCCRRNQHWSAVPLVTKRQYFVRADLVRYGFTAS